MVQQTPAAQRWTAIIDEQEASGQTIRAFAADRGLNISTLSWWRCHLGRSRARKAGKRDQPVAFDEVAIADEQNRGTVVLAFDRLHAHVVIDDDTDLALLRDVLDALC